MKVVKWEREGHRIQEGTSLIYGAFHSHVAAFSSSEVPELICHH